MNTIKKYLRKFKRSLAYFKQGWKSDDYDYVYLVDDIVFKLERIKNHIRKHGILMREDINEITKNIDEINSLFVRYRNDDFWEDFDKLDAEFGETDIDFFPTENPNFLRAVFTRKKETPENRELIEKLESIAYEKNGEEKTKSKTKSFLSFI